MKTFLSLLTLTLFALPAWAQTQDPLGVDEHLNPMLDSNTKLEAGMQYSLLLPDTLREQGDLRDQAVTALKKKRLIENIRRLYTVNFL